MLMPKHFFSVLSLILWLFGSTSLITYSQTTIQFTLDKSYTTSAGAYKPDGTLVRTLWRKEPYAAGTHTAAWDGKDDEGNAVPEGQYQIKVLYHNMQYVWEGAIGNTSLPQSGPRVFQGYLPIRDMTVTDTTMYYVTGFNEGQSNLHRFRHTNTRSKTNVGRVDGFTAVSLMDTDGTNVYLANNEGGVNSGGTTSFIYGVKVSDNSELRFTAGQEVRLNGSYPNQIYPSVIDLDQNSTPLATTGITVLSNAATGLAVQKIGRVLAVAHRNQNVIRLFDKGSGNLLRTISITAPTSLSMSPNGDLWAISGTSVVRYTNLDSNPSVITTIPGFVQPLALATDPTTDDLVLVADGGSSQQVKAFNRSGAARWTYGQQGGYPVNGNEIRNDKLWFEHTSLGSTTFLTVAPDRSFWVGDPGNNRCLHFSSSRAYVGQIMYQPHTYAASVDANNSGRVFSDFLEFQVDYNKDIGDSWTLVRNWRAGLDAKYIGFFQGLRQVTTLSNGRTYAFIRVPAQDYMELVELSGTRIRPTGIHPSAGPSEPATMMPDGSLHLAPFNPAVNSTATWRKRALTGFDATGNPQWAVATALSSAPAGSQDPVSRIGGFGEVKTPVTSTGVVLSFDYSKNNGWHLGGMKTGGTQWLWKAAPTGPLDGKGTYDIGNGVEYAGNNVMGSGRNVVYGYHGEFWGGAQASQWMHFYDDGLFVGQFGETTQGRAANEGVLAGAAGNGVSPNLTVVNGETYMWVNDEGGHGPMRWHLVGAYTMQEAIGSGSLNSTISLNTPTVNFPLQVTPTSSNAQIRLDWAAVSGASSYVVKYALSPGGPYTVAATGVSATSITIPNLTNGTSYYFVVAAQLFSGAGPNSAEVTAKPYDPNVPVHFAGQTASNYTEFTVNSIAPAVNQPALQVIPALRYNPDKLALEGVGSRGYVIYNWNGAGSDKTNVQPPFTVTKDAATWRNDNYVKFKFKVDDTLGSDYSLYSNPAGRINITVSDNNWHYVTAFCPARFADARRFKVLLTPQGQTAPASTYTVSEDLGKNHIVQFRFKGNVTLTVDSQNGTVGTLQAIFLDDEVVSATPVPTFPVAQQPAPNTPIYRLNAGGSALGTTLGAFAADQYFSPAPGNTYTTGTAIAGTTDDALYQSERYGSTLAYALPVANGTYTVVLHFAEIFYTSAGRRVFDVTLEGTKVLDNYDIFTKAGAAFTARTETFTVNVTDGTLNLSLSSLAADGGTDNAKLSGIEVLAGVMATSSSNARVLGATSATETVRLDDAHVYPNPAPDGRVTVVLPSPYKGELQYSLFSLQGKRLTSGTLPLATPTSILPLDFSSIMRATGIYLLRLEGNGMKVQLKLIR